MAKVLKWPSGLVRDKGSAGEQLVAEKLAQLGDNWVIINDLTIKNGKKKTQVDHIILGPPGVYCVETKSWQTACCNEAGDWFRFQGGMWVPQLSPVEQNLDKVHWLTSILNEIFPPVKVFGMVVFAVAGRFDFSRAKITDEQKVFGLPGFIEYLDRQEKGKSLLSKAEIELLSARIYPGNKMP